MKHNLCKLSKVKTLNRSIYFIGIPFNLTCVCGIPLLLRLVLLSPAFMLERIWDLGGDGLGSGPVLPLATWVTLSKGLNFSKSCSFFIKMGL